MMNELFITEKVRVGDLVPSVINPRKIKAAKKQQLWEKLQKFGFISIPVRDFDNTLLGGKQRCELMVQYGLADHMIDVRKAVRKLTDEEIREVMVIENSHAGEWDLEILKREFDAFIDLGEYDLLMEEISEAVESVSEVTEEPEMPIVPIMAEKYTCIVVVCRNEIDENHVMEKLDLGIEQCYKSKNVGMTRVIDAKRLIQSWK